MCNNILMIYIGDELLTETALSIISVWKYYLWIYGLFHENWCKIMLEACENVWWSLAYGPEIQQDKLQTYEITFTKYVWVSVSLNYEVRMSVSEFVYVIAKNNVHHLVIPKSRTANHIWLWVINDFITYW